MALHKIFSRINYDTPEEEYILGPIVNKHITKDDIFASVNYLIALSHGIGQTDDIDHLGILLQGYILTHKTWRTIPERVIICLLALASNLILRGCRIELLGETAMRRTVHIGNIVNHIDKSLTDNRIGQILILATTQLIECIVEVSHSASRRSSYSIAHSRGSERLPSDLSAIIGCANRVTIIDGLELLDATPTIHPHCIIGERVLEIVATLLLCLGCEVFLGNVGCDVMSPASPSHCALHTTQSYTSYNKGCYLLLHIKKLFENIVQ